MEYKGKTFDLKVLYEDNHLIAVYKYPGMIAQEDKTGDMPLGELVQQHLKEKYNKPGNVFVGLVHRLDRPVSGVIVFAKTSKGLFKMNAVFKKREIAKTYLAIVRDQPPKETGTLIHWLKKDPTTNTTTAYPKETEGGLRSELTYKLLGELDGFYLLEVNPITGRSHQIRTQLASMGCPIVGDNKYGYKRGNKDRSICLHAYRLSFVHPIKKMPVDICAGLPQDDFWRKFETILPDVMLP